MVENVLNDFKRDAGALQHWQTLNNPEHYVVRAHVYLKQWLKELTTYPSAHYNDDEKLREAIDDTIFRARAVLGWAEGLMALWELCRCGEEQVRAGYVGSLACSEGEFM